MQLFNLIETRKELIILIEDIFFKNRYDFSHNDAQVVLMSRVIYTSKIDIFRVTTDISHRL